MLTNQSVRQRTLAFLGEKLSEHAVDFGGSFFCIALSKGHSNNIHLDNTDHKKSYAFIMPLGDFTGGDTLLPTLGLSIPVKPGQLLAITASFLPHYISAVTGPRYVATFFTDLFIGARTRDVLLQMGYPVSDLNFMP
jgi:hypothetical protein